MKTSACMMMMIMVLITTAVGMAPETEKETGEKAMTDMEIIERRSWGMRKVAEDGGVHEHGSSSSSSSVEYENEKERMRMINGDEKKNDNKGVMESCMMSQEHCEKKKAACMKSCIHEHPRIQKESVAVKCSFKCKKCAPEC
ncbi:hypothetical protein IHE45_01G050900 [Dioscorea alata]|uniref:Uncharacterized protein n=1 Tax=Dioscorea alata TaxID=55571 RepID=A0ACB7WV01_DIOAL|nr:hypothetical protein IHE45_01G050900 [Dioscorea alata]